MPAIWALMRAVRGSSLPPTDRHILMTLISLADPESGVIPDRFQPSFSDLANFTGLGRSTVGRRLPFIEEAGWLKRTAPSLLAAWKDKEKNSYVLMIPTHEGSNGPDSDDQEGDLTSPTAGLVPEGDQSDDWSQSGTSPRAGLGLVPERDRTSPTVGLEVPDLRTKRTNTPPSEVLFDVAVEPPPTEDEPKKRTRSKAKVADEERADVVEICQYLADAVAAGGSKKPPIGKRWFTEARLLLDEERKPQATVERVKALIDWIQTNAWWKARVLAMPKLRAKYDEIRLDAVRDFDRKKTAGGGNGSGYTAQRVNIGDDTQRSNAWKERKERAQKR